MSVVSGKALWSIICGQCVLPSDEVVGEELETAATHLQEGFLHFRIWSEDDHKSWCTKSKLKKQHQGFVYKLAKMLEICSEQAWELFQLFLQYEYRGAASQLQTAISCEREELNLLHQVFYFSLSDPLHLLSCRRHILAADSSHPYEKLFKEFINKVLDPERSLGKKLVTQLRKMNMKDISTTDLSSHLPPKASQAKLTHRLSALKHQLVTLMVYHASPDNPCPPDTLLTLLQLAQGVGLGRELVANFSGGEQISVKNQLEVIDVFHSFLLTLAINADSDPKTNALCTPEWVSRLTPMINSLGSKPWHSAPLLAWAILQGRRVALEPEAGQDEASKYSRLVQRAIKNNVFGFIKNALKIPAFETDRLLLVIGSSVAYSLICIVGTCLDLDKIGLMQEAVELARVCLPFEPTSHFFWNEPGGGASVLLPNAMEVFPHNSSPLFDVLRPLAQANEFSAGKVFELMTELESFTWPLRTDTVGFVSINGNQCVSRMVLNPLPEIIVPKDSHGFIMNALPPMGSDSQEPILICWQIPVCGWRVLLASVKLLASMIDSGVVPDDWSLSMVVGGLGVASACFRSNPALRSTSVAKELHMAAHKLLISSSQILKPSYQLISALFEFFSGSSKVCLGSLWNDLDGAPLLPFLTLSKTGRVSKDLLSSYMAGNARSLICGVEAKLGRFCLLKRLCSLVENSLKHGLQPGSVRGCAVFLVKEVVPSMLLWSFADASERIEVIEATFSLLHNYLAEGALDRTLQNLIVLELSNAQGGAGATLKRVLESIVHMESTLDQPAEWPHSSHANKVTKMAKLALSLAHRLVNEFLSSGDGMKRFFLESSSVGSQMGGFVASSLSLAHRAPHLALTIAQFAHHRINPRLPYLALKTLTRLAKEMDVSLVACLGAEAEGLRDCLLVRLESATEDMMVKVALLRLLSLSTVSQPGLIRLFLTPPQTLLDSVVGLLQTHKECKTEAEAELMLSLVELVSSLFEKNLVTATTHLRPKKEFWDSLSHLLCRKRPGCVRDDIVGGVFKVYAMESFNAGGKFEPDFSSNLDAFLKVEIFSSWLKHIYETSVKGKLDAMETESGTRQDEDLRPPTELLSGASDFFVVLLSKAPGRLTSEHTNVLGVSVIESLLSLFESSDESWDSLRISLAETHLVVANHLGVALSGNKSYNSLLVRLLGVVQSTVMQTSVRCQVLILSAALKVLTSFMTNSQEQELVSSLVDYCVQLVEQRCALSSSPPDDESGVFSRSVCLALACALLYQCLEPLEGTKIDRLLQVSNVVPALLDAAVKHVEFGNVGVVRELQRLLSLFIRRSRSLPQLSTDALAESISLVLSSQHQSDPWTLRDLLWCTTFCLRKEGGAAGLEGAISLVAVHLPAITSALASPAAVPDLALAAASLASTLAPFHQLWRVAHPDCFERVVAATAGCVQVTTKVLHLKESLEREVCEREGGAASSPSKATPAGLSQSTTKLINQLLKILATSLWTIQLLSPDLAELLRTPGIESPMGAADLVEPSIRRHSGAPGTLPNLATLADILDLYHTLVPKEGRSTNNLLRMALEPSTKVDAFVLRQCAEVALHLLLTYSVLFIVDPTVPPREARDVRTFLADETSSFFSQWLGRRTVSASSPLIPPQSPKSPLSDLPYFMLCRQLVSSVCNSNT